jgi:hypothetical protein
MLLPLLVMVVVVMLFGEYTKKYWLQERQGKLSAIGQKNGWVGIFFGMEKE